MSPPGGGGGGGPVNGDSREDQRRSGDSRLLDLCYWHNPIVQARKMANPKYLALLKRGIAASNEWCQKAREASWLLRAEVIGTVSQ